MYDCAGVCGGLAFPDCNGACGGNAVPDCAGVCNGHAVQYVSQLQTLLTFPRPLIAQRCVAVLLSQTVKAFAGVTHSWTVKAYAEVLRPGIAKVFVEVTEPTTVQASAVETIISITTVNARLCHKGATTMPIHALVTRICTAFPVARNLTGLSVLVNIRSWR